MGGCEVVDGGPARQPGRRGSAGQPAPGTASREYAGRAVTADTTQRGRPPPAENNPEIDPFG